MPVQKVNDTSVLEAALYCFRTRGYHGTSMADIAEHLGILKGSLYHYYPSKEALMLKLLQNVRDYFQRKAFEQAKDPNIPADLRMARFVEVASRFYQHPTQACLMGSTGLHTFADQPLFQPVIRGFFQDWIEAFTAIYSAHLPAPEARQLAEQSVAEVEGAILMMCLMNNLSFFQQAMQQMQQRASLAPA